MAPVSLSVGVGVTQIQNPVVRYDPSAEALFARMTSQPTPVRKKLYSDLIVALKDSGVWATLDALYVRAAHSSQAARLNIVQEAFTSTAVSSPVFEVDRGYTGDGSSSYLDWNLNPVTDVGLKLSQNNMAFSVWMSDSNPGSNAYDAGQGGTTNTSIIARNTNNQIITRPQCASNMGSSSTITDVKGLTGWGRSDGLNASLYKNGARLFFTGAIASSALVSSKFTSLRASTGYSGRRVSAEALGTFRTTAQELALYNALNTYMTAVGAN